MTRIPTEAQEQKALFEWAAYSTSRHPELALLFHIPNEARRSYSLGREMKAQGLRSGVPDICLPVPRGGYGALYIELKRCKDGRLSDNQRGWLNGLNRAGNKAVVCRGWEEARQQIEMYLNQ
jgi:hypothetical protein